MFSVCLEYIASCFGTKLLEMNAVPTGVTLLSLEGGSLVLEAA